MSNAQVGVIYQQIIADVIETSRTDLEENGVDESILEELQQGWQKKLSLQNLAVFPWDPKPDPPPPAAAAAPVAAPPPPAAPAVNDAVVPNGSGMPPQGMAQTGAPAYPAPAGQPAVKTESGVKIEPGLESATVAQAAQFTNPSLQARVINNLQSQFGARADATINKLQESIGSAGNGAQYAGQPRPGQPTQQHPNAQFQAQQHAQQQYRQQQFAAGPGQQRPPQPMPNGQKPSASQFDGAAEEGVVVRRDAEGNTTELGRVEIDRMLHAQLEARAKAMEGGGLMLPLKRATKKNPVSYHRAQGGSGSGRFDGGDDDVKSEEDDEAINSDLDDSDDNVDEDDEDEDGGQIMLCMYDKVQRVKNKWKCVLKDGVLSVNGKDYVFHKASGEYEW